MDTTRKPLPGSERTESHYKKADRQSSSAHKQEDLRFSIVLKHAPEQGHTENLTREQILASFGPSEEAIDLVKKFAEQYGLRIESINRTQRKVNLSGSIENIESAFKTHLIEYVHPEGNYLSHEGALSLPVALHPYVLGVMGLHRKPVMKPQAAKKRGSTDARTKQVSAEARELTAAEQVVYSNFPTVLAKLYDFPEDLDGSHQKIALLQLGGGYVKSDLETYFKDLKLDLPVIRDITVDGGINNPHDQAARTLEVYSDICMAGAVANKAELLVYFASNNHLHSLAEIFQEAVYDKDNAPGIISCSWGSAEREWNPNDINILESVLVDASKLHITTFVASGDGGSGDDTRGINVDYPASSPWVLGCGGTVAYVDADYNTIVDEIVWNGQNGSQGATGGGVSEKIPLPEWQKEANVPPNATRPAFKGRGVPDFAAVAGFHRIFMFGKYTVTGGTSCGAPFLAGLMALANQKAGKDIGYINEILYKSKLLKGHKIFRDITTGSNGRYHAREGWNCCTGLGRPFGSQFVNVLTSAMKSATAKV